MVVRNARRCGCSVTAHAMEVPLKSGDKQRTKRSKSAPRAVPLDVRQQVLVEAGFRCAVPTCRTILALDLHHIVELSKGGQHDVSNLIALCANCHALYHRGTITLAAMMHWKGVLVSLSRAFDQQAVDD